MLRQVVNHHLLRDLTERDLWDDEMKNQLIGANGSIQVSWIDMNIYLKMGRIKVSLNYPLTLHWK